MNTETENSMPLFNPADYTIEHVTRPLLKWTDGKTYFFRIDSPIFQADRNEGEKDDKKEPPFLYNAIDLTTGEEVQMIAPKVLHSELEKKYPDHGYVGRNFRAVKTKLEDKRYSTFQISELIKK